jgi:hypothetical protein
MNKKRLSCGLFGFFSCLALLAALLLRMPCAQAGSDGEDPDGLPGFALQWEFPDTTGMPLSLAGDDEGRPYLYVANKEGGVLVMNTSRPSLPVVESAVPRSKLSGLDAMAVTQQGHYLFVALGDFFDIKGARVGLGIIDVSKPAAPAVTAVWVSGQNLRGASAVLASGNIVYVSAMQAGILVFDVSDKKKPQLLSSFQPYVDFPHKNPKPMATPKARGMALHENLLLLADDAGGLRLIDATDPRRLKEKAAYINADLMRKQQSYNAVALDWPTAYVTTDYCGVEIVDLSDLKNIHQKGMWNPWHCDSLLNYWFNSKGHANQIALDPAKHRLYMTAGISPLRVLDISDPVSPALVAGYGHTKEKAASWGLALTDGTIYVSYIKAPAPFGGNWSGIRALKR